MEIFEGFLEKLNDKEIEIICNNANLDFFLAPMKKEPNVYKKYIKSLGRCDKNSPVVKKLLPKYAYDLYIKRDENYKKALELVVAELKRNFEKSYYEVYKSDISLIKNYNIDNFVDLYCKIDNLYLNNISYKLFFVCLKLEGVIFDKNDYFKLKNEIEKLISEKKDKELHKKEIEEALKKQEKQLNLKFDQEKESYQKDNKKISRVNEQLKKEIVELNTQIQYYKNNEESEHKKIIEEWNKVAQKEIEQKKREQENKLSQIYNQKLASMKKKIDEEKANQEKLVSTEIDNLRKLNQVEIEKLNSDILKLKNEKNQLEKMNDFINSEYLISKSKLENLQQIEDEYFENIDKRIYEKKFDEELVKKINFICNSKTDKCIEKNNSIVKVYNNIWTKENQINTENFEECESANTLLEFKEDLRDNISLYFDEAMDISATVIAALLFEKVLIVEQGIAYILAKCISSITSKSMPYCIRIHDTSIVNLSEIIDIINKQTNKTILIDGILDKYDESLFAAICSECPNKYLIFCIADINDLNIFSKSINNFSICLDIDEYYTYESGEPLLFANNNIFSYLKDIDYIKCKTCYDKIFRKLVSEKLVSKKISIDFSKIIYIYFKIIGKESICDVMKKSILQCCNIKDNQEIEKTLVRVGLK